MVVQSKNSEASLVPAVFANRASAESAIEALREAGIVATDIGVAVPARETNRIREEAPGDALQGAGRGLAVGAPLGALGGIGLAALALGPLGVGGLFLAGASGLVWGGTVGGMLGMVTRIRRSPDVDRWCELELDERATLVVVRVRDWMHEPELADLLKRAGATAVLDQLDLDHTWDELEIVHPSGQGAPVG